MNYKIWFDESKEVLYFKPLRTMTDTDIHDVFPLIQKNLEGKKRRLVLGDFSENPSNPLTKEARAAFKDHKDISSFDKIAVVGSSPITRMTAKIALTILRLSDVARFFKTEEEALNWLSEHQ